VSAPLIGITSYVETASWGVWELPAALIPHVYVQKVQAAGGVAVVIPPLPSGATGLVERLDGLILAGGADISPSAYGAERHAETIGVRPDRDASELALLAAAYERDLPVLGICRGMQLMCVAAGGRLEQHLPDAVGHDAHRAKVGVFGTHEVSLDGLVGRLLGERLAVPSYHHQGAVDAGSLAISGRADDGVIEAVEDPGRRFTIGVQWHPEMSDDDRLFRALVSAGA
jgi:putative glutamine amidotransferase